MSIQTNQICNWFQRYEGDRVSERCENKSILKVELKMRRQTNSRSSCYSCADVSDVVWEKFGQPKVSNFWVIILIKKYITSFNVPMNNMLHGFFMQKS